MLAARKGQSERCGSREGSPDDCRLPEARRRASGRPWRPRPAPDATCARRSCNRAAPPAPPCRRAARDQALSNIAWCRLGSNFSPIVGSNFFTPCFSSTLCSSRSVSSTPSSSALIPASAFSRSSASSACERAIHVVGDCQDVARESRNAVGARIRDLASGALGAGSPSRQGRAAACPCTRPRRARDRFGSIVSPTAEGSPGAAGVAVPERLRRCPELRPGGGVSEGLLSAIT